MTNMIKQMCLSLAVVLLVTGCASNGRYELNIDQTEQVGFSQQEIIDLGQIVNVAYTQFKLDARNFSPSAPSQFVAGYQAIKNLHSQDKPGAEKREFYGYVARSTVDPQHLIISIRGTSDADEWLDDIKFGKVPFSDNPNHGHVELGFKEVFQGFAVSDFDSDVSHTLDDYLGALDHTSTLTVVGHSLGSSLATLVAFDASTKGYADEVRILTFASPRTGNNQFSDAFISQIHKSLRVVNKPDIVTRVPPKLFKFRHVWHELEINSRPDPSIKNSVTCFHSLSTYLYVLTRNKSAVKIEPTAECLTI